MNHTEAAHNIGKALQQAISAKDRATKGPDRSDTVFERSSLKSNVELIVSRVGRDVPMEYGYTLQPVVTAFIPRLIWPGKPDVQTGRLMNKVFNLSPVEDTYISPSHIGELYWNFGWSGVVVGMFLFGLLLGYIGSRTDLSQAPTLTRVMVIVLTARLIVLGAEGAIAPQYVVWMRSMLAIGLMHLFLARTPVTTKTETSGSELDPATGQDTRPRFANLMR
jgi:hypothetical protein